jgi:hypothetical protein
MAKLHVAVAEKGDQYIPVLKSKIKAQEILESTGSVASWAGAAGRSNNYWNVTPLDGDGWVNFDGDAEIELGWPVFQGITYSFECDGTTKPTFIAAA